MVPIHGSWKEHTSAYAEVNRDREPSCSPRREAGDRYAVATASATSRWRLPIETVFWWAGPILVSMVLLECGGCQKGPGDPSPSPKKDADARSGTWFELVSPAIGIDFTHDAGVRGNYFMPEQMGSGCAFLDYNRDGRLDIYLIQCGGPSSQSPNRLYRQDPDGGFRDASAGSGLDVTGYGMGVAVGDANNDGWPDVVVTEYGKTRFFLNRTNGTFVDATKDWGLDNPRWGTSAAFVDYNRDGWLDLVVANYLDYDPTQRCTDARGQPEYCGPHGFPGLVTRLFRNRGPAAMGVGTGEGTTGGGFVDVTLEAGLAIRPGPALGVYCADFTGDHWPDIFLADDARPNRLFVNRRDGTFAEEAAERGLAYNTLGQTAGNMGIAAGDVDGDGLFDVFVTHLAEEQHSLWRQQPRGLFQDQFGESGLALQAMRGTGFGAVLADMDLDGALDLAFVNGRVKRAENAGPAIQGLSDHWIPYAQFSQLFANRGQGAFADRSGINPAFCSVALVGRGLACGDWDNDGDVDLLVTGTGGPALLYRNVAPRRGHWLAVIPRDPRHGGREAYGAEVVLVHGSKRRWGSLNPASSYLSSHAPTIHFGLGADQVVDAIHVVWPDGVEEEFGEVAVDRVVELIKGRGRPATKG